MLFSKSLEKYIPHSCEQLDETSIPKGKGNDNVGLCNTSGTNIDQGEDKSSQGESTETEGSRIGEFSFGGGLVETGLKLSTESWESS
jgi:hypothetical protein